MSVGGSTSLTLFPIFDVNGIVAVMSNPMLLSVLVVVFSVALVVEIPLFALKFKNFSWADNKQRYLFLIIDAILLLLLGVYAVPVIILFYVVLSMLVRKV